MSLQPRNLPNHNRRKLLDRAMRGLTVVATLFAVVPLVLIIGYVLVVGGSALNTQFFTEAYKPPLTVGAGLGGDIPDAAPDQPAAPAEPGATADPFANLNPENAAGTGAADAGATPVSDATADPFANLSPDSAVNSDAASTPIPASGVGSSVQASATNDVIAQGGVLHAIVGTLLITSVALLIAVPIGLLAGVFLAEYPANPVATFVRFCCDVLSGAPSIIVGVVAYILIVQRVQAFSGLAGSVALTFLMVPTITRTTEEILKLVPNSTREAALAMGAPVWYATFTVVIPTALTGIITGVLLAFARGAGETAPLLLTVLGNNELTFNMLGPIAALPLLTYRYTESPFPSENNLAWGTAFVLMVLVLVVNILVRFATRSRLRSR